MNSYNHAALIIAGHGSTLNPDSSTPTHKHADTLRKMGLFREVAVSFWKEEPSMREVYESLDSEVIYIVPNFISQGYFCQQVVPREFQLTGPITHREGRSIYYCEPVGIHPNMTRLLIQRADEVAPGVSRHEISLIIVGHGTNLNDNSTKAIQDQVELIREGGFGFAHVTDAYMEEAPFVADWDQLATTGHVVIVPFFIADGLHSYQDIPVLLGMTSEPGKAASQDDVFRHNPIELKGRKVYYSSAIGTEPLLAEVILDQVHDFDKKYDIPPIIHPPQDTILTSLVRWLAENHLLIGQIHIEKRGFGGYSLCHIDDVILLNSGVLTQHTDPVAARDIARYTAKGEFRPLKTAPNLRRGWQMDLEELSDLKLALDFFYPAALGKAHAEEAGKLEKIPLRQLLGRQTGMYRFTNTITDDQANDMIQRCCDTKTQCLRRIVFPLSDTQPLGGGAVAKTGNEAGHLPGADWAIPLLCMEACTHIVSEARKIAQQNHNKGSETDSVAAPESH